MSEGNAASKGYSYADFLLDPSTLRCTRSPRGSLILHIGQEEYTDLNIRRAFPLEDGNRYIGFSYTTERSWDCWTTLRSQKRRVAIRSCKSWTKSISDRASRRLTAWTRNSACCEVI